MGKRIGQYRKNIATLESLWYDDIEKRVNVKPILEIVSRMHEIKYVHLTCSTRNEFIHNLRLIKKKSDYGILYLAFHGRPGEIILADDGLITLEVLSQFMGQSFSNWIVHFGACGTISVEDTRLNSFVQSTEIRMISGYTNNKVDWIESAAMDLLYFQKAQEYDDMELLWLDLKKNYGELLSITGLQVFLPPLKNEQSA